MRLASRWRPQFRLAQQKQRLCPSACGNSASVISDLYACRANGLPTTDKTCIDNDVKKPASTTSCAATPKCVTYAWVADAFSSCNQTCGVHAHTITRSVRCIGSDANAGNDTQCDLKLQPAQAKACAAVVCPAYAWKPDSWLPSVCPAVKCDAPTLVMSRFITCEQKLGKVKSTVDRRLEGTPDRFGTLRCSVQQKPATSLPCATAPKCVYNWTSTKWSPLQACPACGFGAVKLTRKSSCANQDGQITLRASDCKAPRPSATLLCSATPACRCAVVAPTNGKLGACKTSLDSGAKCEPKCSF
eukprot:COSAG01_NODE_17561_length_1141_cov_1.143954_1_plen_301_part_10